MKILVPLLLALATVRGHPQQTPDLPSTPAGAAAAQRPEPALQELARRDRGTVVLALNGKQSPARSLDLHGFAFNGESVDTAKLHLRQLSPGVFELTSRSYEVGYWRFAVRDAAAGIYGLGEHSDTLNHAHTVVRNLALPAIGARGSTTAKPIPFFLSTTGYGLWVDTPGEATFDFDAADPGEITIEATTDRLRVVLFTGVAGQAAEGGSRPGRFPVMLKEFAALTGPLTVPPPWAFGPWYLLGGRPSQEEILEDAARARALGLPLGVVALDTSEAANAAVSDPARFHEAPALVERLHADGFKLVLGQSAWLAIPGDVGQSRDAAKRSPYDEAADAGFLVSSADGKPLVREGRSPIDFTNPRARVWFQKQVAERLAAGADGLLDEDGEASFLGASAGPGDAGPESSGAVFADRSDPRLMRNRYATLFHAAAAEQLQRDRKGDGVLLARSLSTGSNGLGLVIDDDRIAGLTPGGGLAAAVTAGLSAGLSGMPLWASGLGADAADAGSAAGPLELERWAEFAAFTPAMLLHPGHALTPWLLESNAALTPAFETYRRYAVLHQSLFPYRYAAALQAARSGTPILRALVLEFQDDPRARETRDEYLFGPDLLVAPVVDENTSRVVYLPAGEWLNLFTGEAVTGPATRIEAAPLASIPVYARRGTILPKIPDDVLTLAPALDARRVYELLGPAAPTPTALTDFEGRQVVRDGDAIRFSGGPNAHVILLWKFQTPRTVTLDGAPAKLTPGAGGVATLEFDYTGAPLTVIAR